MKNINTSLITSAIKCDFFNDKIEKNLLFANLFRNLKQFVNILQKNKTLPVCIVLDENSSANFNILLKKYLKFSKQNKVKVITNREALEYKEQAIFLFFFDKKKHNTVIFKSAYSSHSFPLVFDYSNKKKKCSFYKILGGFNNYRQFLFLISLISSVKLKTTV